MQYMLMCCFEQNSWETLPETERAKIMQEYGTLIQDLVKSGQFRGGAQLYPTSSATTVRMKNGKPVITDGPFAETKEQLGGYHVIECRNLNEAISIAARIPTLPAGGTIEVRPVMPSPEREYSVR
ncbi:MAG TPA: YciI family protein [Nitrospira sp.]